MEVDRSSRDGELIEVERLDDDREPTTPRVERWSRRAVTVVLALLLVLIVTPADSGDQSRGVWLPAFVPPGLVLESAELAAVGRTLRAPWEYQVLRLTTDDGRRTVFADRVDHPSALDYGPGYIELHPQAGRAVASASRAGWSSGSTSGTYWGASDSTIDIGELAVRAAETGELYVPAGFTVSTAPETYLRLSYMSEPASSEELPRLLELRIQQLRPSDTEPNGDVLQAQLDERTSAWVRFEGMPRSSAERSLRSLRRVTRDEWAAQLGAAGIDAEPRHWDVVATGTSRSGAGWILATDGSSCPQFGIVELGSSLICDETPIIIGSFVVARHDKPGIVTFVVNDEEEFAASAHNVDGASIAVAELDDAPYEHDPDIRVERAPPKATPSR